METKQIKPRLAPDEMKEMERIAEECEVNPTALAGFFLRAAIRAAKRHGRLRLPVDFEILEEPVGNYRLAETPSKRK